MTWLSNITFWQGLIVFLILLLFAKDSLIGWISKWLGYGEEDPIGHLSMYYNHDLTEKLDAILTAEQDEHRTNDQLKDTLKDLATTLREFKEYGIKCRKD